MMLITHLTRLISRHGRVYYGFGADFPEDRRPRPRRFWQSAVLPTLWVGLAVLLFFIPLQAHAQTTPQAQGNSGLIWDYPGGLDAYVDAPFVPGELLVGVHASAVAAAGVQTQAGLDVLETVDMAGLDGGRGDAGVAAYRVRVSPGAEWSTIARLRTQPGIAFVTPNWLVTAAAGDGSIINPAATGADDESGLELQGAIEAPYPVDDPLYANDQWYVQRVNASRAWAVEGAGGATVRVAVVDSGVDTSHPELLPHLLPGKNYVSSDPTAPPLDDYGHGTHVTGVIAATINNNAGMAGLALNVKIDPRKVLNSGGSGSLTDVADAIRDATDDGAQIINLSLEASATSPVLTAAVEYAAANGVLLVAAAGNCPQYTTCPVSWPAAYDEVIAVGSTDYWDQRASYSAVGPELEIMAPGGGLESTSSAGQIYSAWSIEAVPKCMEQSGSDYQLIDGGSYCNRVGTSMAAGVLSGAAALVWSAAPDLTAYDLRTLLNATAKPMVLGTDYVGHGRLDVQAAMLTLLTPKLTPYPRYVQESVPVGTQPFSLTVTLENPSLATLAYTATLSDTDGWIRFADTADYPVDGDVRYGAPGYLVLEITPTDLVTGTHSAHVTVTATDATGAFAGAVDVPITLLVGRSLYIRYLPFVGNLIGNSTPIVSRAFRWEAPNDDGRVVRTLTDGSNVGVPLPFPFTMGDSEYTDLRLYSDGFVSFPASAVAASPQENRCFPVIDTLPAAIYGWWAHLDPARGSGRVSYFQTTSGDFVVEFMDVESAAGVEPAYKVSFQIVLQPEGDIWLNYLTVPEQTGAPPPATLGASRADGRFYNRIFCRDDATYGLPPAARESFELKEEDLY